MCLGCDRLIGYAGVMATRTEEVRRQALALAEADRANLAADLLASLDDAIGEADAGVEAAWAEELERRALALMSGESQVTSWEEVRESIVGELAG